MLAGLTLFPAANLTAYPVYYFITTVPKTISGPDPMGLNGQPVTVSGSLDTTAVPVSSGVNCSAGTNCNTYNVPSVQLSAGGVSLAITNMPLTITVNSGTTPDTFSTTTTVPFGNMNIPLAFVVGISAGALRSPTPDGVGVAAIVPGTAPFTFGSVLNYGQGTNATQMSLTGVIDGVNLLHTFSGTRGTGTDGGFPQSALTQVALKSGTSTFSGTTFGAALQGLNSTLFGVTNATNTVDSLKTLHRFNASTEGNSAAGELLPASNGMLYGVGTTGGPANTGTIFDTTPGSTSVSVVNATLPLPLSVIEASDGNLYGVTGSPTASNVFFQLSLTGTVTPLHTFTTEGNPSGPLFQANDGNFYGETTGPGASFGMLYRITTAGVLTPLYTFTNGTDGANPAGGMFQASNGLLYGLAAGGAHGSGVIFSINTGGTKFSTVHAFSGTDGATPSGGLVQASDNNLYGITSAGGTAALGTVFRVSLTNVFGVVHNFSGSDGEHPMVPGPALVQGSDGLIYGTTSSSITSGGTAGGGTAFSLDLRLPLPKTAVLRFSPASGPVGTTVTIYGRNLLGATKITFNGTAATGMHSKGVNYVTAVVPTGATTGPIAVTTPNGKATSTASFTVQ